MAPWHALGRLVLTEGREMRFIVDCQLSKRELEEFVKSKSSGFCDVMEEGVDCECVVRTPDDVRSIAGSRRIGDARAILSEAMNMTDDADVDENIEYCIEEETGDETDREAHLP